MNKEKYLEAIHAIEQHFGESSHFVRVHTANIKDYVKFVEEYGSYLAKLAPLPEVGDEPLADDSVNGGIVSATYKDDVHRYMKVTSTEQGLIVSPVISGDIADVPVEYQVDETELPAEPIKPVKPSVPNKPLHKPTFGKRGK